MTPLDRLNIAALCPSSTVLGPGKRFIIWVQGCCFDCFNCGSPEWREDKDALLITPEDLAQRILNVAGLDGITISGGEPMLQAGNLLKTIKLVRSVRALSIICYTGFTLHQLQESDNTDVLEILQEIDVIIDGPYVDSLNDNKGWRGSSNQNVYFLSGIYKDSEDKFLNRARDIEIHLLQNHYLMVGIHPKGFHKALL